MDEFGNVKPQTENDLARAQTTKEHALRTYSSDMAKALKQNQGSVIKIAMAEQSRKARVAEIPTETKKKKVWVVFILIAVLLGFCALGIAWYFSSPKSVPEKKPISLQDSMIFVEKEKVFSWSGNRDTVLQNLSLAKNEMLQNKNQMMNVFGVVTNGTTTSKALFSNLSTVLGMSVSKSFSIDTVKDFMLGVDSNDSGSHYFIIISAKSFDVLFSGMIAWEKTALKDTYEIFGMDNIVANRNLETKWTDKTINNIDMRILYDENKNIILMYGYAMSDTIILTDNQLTFDRVLGRLQDRAVK